MTRGKEERQGEKTRAKRQGNNESRTKEMRGEMNNRVMIEDRTVNKYNKVRGGGALGLEEKTEEEGGAS